MKMIRRSIFLSLLLAFGLPRGFCQLSGAFIDSTGITNSCHASSLVQVGNEILATWFGGAYEGHKEVNIYLSHFREGRWSEPEVIADGWINDSIRYACYNPVLFFTPQKELLLFYKIGPYVQGWTGWMKRSKDGGRTWSKPEPLPEGILGPIRNQPIYLNQQLICPSSTEKGGWKVHFEYTSDWGKTWTKGPDLNDANPITGIQPAVLIHKNGLQALCRSQNGTLNETWSYDGGKSWSPLKQSETVNNNSGIAAITLKDGRHLLVYNNVQPDPTSKEGIGPRSPLNLAISTDGKKWTPIATLENEPGSEFSYPYVIQGKDGSIHISYTWKRKRIKYVRISLAELANLTRVR